MSLSRRSPGFCAVVHLPALPGAPRASGRAYASLRAIQKLAVAEARVFEELGFDSLILENFGDVPFVKGRVDAVTVAAMSVVASAVRASVRIPIGINLLRNDGRSALAVAAATGCNFIRVNVLSGVAATDQGWIEGEARELLLERQAIAPEVGILADVWVKHARQYSSETLGQAIEETALRAGADAVIVTGAGTGKPAPQSRISEALATCRRHRIPLVLGSGVSAENLASLPLSELAGIIVGSDLRKGGLAGARLERSRARRWIVAARSR